MDWFFPKNDGGQFHGIGDSGIDLFKGEPVKSLTREICQNSIDAGTSEEPVKIQFDLFRMDSHNIPGYQNLKYFYDKANTFCQKQNFVKALKYFEKSIPILNASQIDVLRISDFNTSGLPGATTANSNFTSPWFRLVRSVGSSDKVDGAIGSYGSGKMAAFSCSDIQTVFYNTYVENECEAHQGVTKLIGFLDEENHLYSDIGYYCEELSMPILSQLKLEDNYIRKTPGTDIYIIGFKFSKDNWKKDLITSVLDGFFYAIQENHLIVEVGNTTINSQELPRLIEEYKNDIDDKTYDYYRIMTSGKATTRSYSLLENNDVEISMLVESGYHKRVAIIRYPGMKIFDKGNISTTVPFSGICVIKGTEISKLLGGLENIQHNKWELSRYDNSDLKNAARKQRDALYNELQKLFKELRGQDSEGEIDPHIGDCLPDLFSKTEEIQQTLTDEILEISQTKELKVVPPSNVDIKNEDGETSSHGDSKQGTSGGERMHEHKTGPKPGSKPGPGPGELPGSNPPLIDQSGEAESIRSIHSNIHFRPIDILSGKYEITISARQDIIDGIIYINIGAENGAYNAFIKSASINGIPLKTHGAKIEGINISKGATTTLNVTIDYSDICSLEVRVYGH